MRAAGFTLVEVVVALVLFGVGMLGVVGTLVLASRTLREAEALERGTSVTESVLDSLRAVGAVAPGARSHPAGQVRWDLLAPGEVEVVTLDPAGDTLARFVAATGGR